MTFFDRCPECHEYDVVSSHRCKPVWEVWSPDLSETRDDAARIRGISSREAAEKWGETYDSDGDYTIVGGSSVRVYVAKPLDDTVRKYEVTGEGVPEYTATEINDAEL